MVMGLLSPRGSQITTKTIAGADDTSAVVATELKWEFDEDLGRCYVYMGTIISSGSFWLMVSKGFLFYAFSRFMPCLVLL